MPTAPGTSPTAHRALERLAPEALEYVEQPLPADAIDALARLRAGADVPIAADESAADLARAEAVIERGAADLLILKPATLRGPVQASGLAAKARRAGIDCAVTGFLDSCVGDAAALHLAASLPDPARAAGLAPPDFFECDLAEAQPADPGVRALTGAPGLGVALDPQRLSKLADGAPLELHRS